MPAFQAMAERANVILNRQNIGKIDDDAVSAPSIAAVAAKLRIAETDAERDFLAKLPPSINDAIAAVVRSAVKRRVPVTVAWAPGYEFELLVSESKTVSGSIGGITVFLRTRYPGD